MPRILIPLRPILGVLQIGIKSQDTIMSDSEHSTVPPSPDYIPGPEGPPSPDYVPGPEEPEQAPPSPIYIPFVPEPVYPEFLPVDDEVFPAEEQPLPAADSPTHQSPGYIPESDPEEDLEEDDEEDPEEDPADYPADRGDDDDDAEDEHLAPAEPAAVAYSADQDPYIAYRVTARMSIRTQAPTPFLSEEVAERLLALPTPPPSPLSPYSSPLPQIPFPPLPISSPPPISPTYVEGSMGSRAAGIRQRDALPVHETEMPEMCLPLRKRPCRTTPGPGCEVGESSAAGAARQFGPTTAEADLYGFTDMLEAALGPVDQGRIEIIYSQLDDARYDRALLRARVNRLDSDRPFYRRTALLIEEEARLTPTVKAHIEITELQAADRRRQAVITDLLKADYRRQRQLAETLKIVKSLKAQMTELQRQQGPAKDPAEPELPRGGRSIPSGKMAPRGRPTRLNPGTTPPPVTDPTTTTSVTSAQLQAMIDEGVTAVLAARATTRNGDDSHTSGTGVRRNERAVRDNCTVENQVKFATCTLMGIALTWWNSHARTVTNEVAYAMTWSDLKKKMTTKYCPRNEIKKVEAELWNLKVKGTDVPKTIQQAIEMATELMDRRINTFAKRQAENKRKFEDTNLEGFFTVKTGPSLKILL
ncbi:putative reverse transcriptase domain-containing protein [Tanacetum coccineum]